MFIGMFKLVPPVLLAACIGAARPCQAQILPGPRDVVINEILADPPASGSEFIELFNRSNKTYLLSGLTVRDAATSPVFLTHAPLELAPNEYVVLVQNGEAFAGQFPTVSYIRVAPWPALNNGGDVVVLEANGAIVDSVAYDAEDTEPDLSLERIDPDAPSDRHNFAPSLAELGATPGVRNSRFARDSVGPRLVYVREQDADVLDLFFDEPIRLELSPPGAIVVDDVRAVAVAPLSPDAFRATFPEALSGGSVTVGVAADLRGNRSEDLAAPIAFRPRPFEIVINEVLYEPLADDRDGLLNQTEYVEILNRSRRLVYVDGLVRTRDPDERGDADTARVIEHRVVLEPEALATIGAHGAAGPHASLTAPSLTLRNDGDLIRLHRSDLVVLDEVRYDPSWHHPDLLQRRGISLERIDQAGRSSDPDNWTSSVDPSGGTPGRRNSVQIAAPAHGHGSALSIDPNPFSPDRDGIDDVVRIIIDPGVESVRIRLRIFDLAGLMVRDIVAAQLVAGSATFLWDGYDNARRRVRTGIYIAVVDVFDARSGREARMKRPFVLARSY